MCFYLTGKIMSELIWTAVILQVVEQKNMSMLTVFGGQVVCFV